MFSPPLPYTSTTVLIVSLVPWGEHANLSAFTSMTDYDWTTPHQPSQPSLIEMLTYLDNNLIKASFFKWMLLECSSCAEDWLIQEQEHLDLNVTSLIVFNYVVTLWRKQQSDWMYKLKHGQSTHDIDYGGHLPEVLYTVWLRTCPFVPRCNSFKKTTL